LFHARSTEPPVEVRKADAEIRHSLGVDVQHSRQQALHCGVQGWRGPALPAARARGEGLPAWAAFGQQKNRQRKSRTKKMIVTYRDPFGIVEKNVAEEKRKYGRWR
jgi:hypothetical protein